MRNTNNRFSHLLWHFLVVVSITTFVAPVSMTAQVPVQKAYGLNFSPYVTGQDPNTGSQISEAQILARLQIIAPYTGWIRSFGSTHGLEQIPKIAHELGLKVAAGAWISADQNQNSTELTNL